MEDRNAEPMVLSKLRYSQLIIKLKGYYDHNEKRPFAPVCITSPELAGMVVNVLLAEFQITRFTLRIRIWE